MATGSSCPRSLKIIRLPTAPRGDPVHDRCFAGSPRAIAPTTCDVYPYGPKMPGFMTDAGVGPSTITVPRGASATATRAVAM